MTDLHGAGHGVFVRSSFRFVSSFVLVSLVACGGKVADGPTDPSATPAPSAASPSELQASPPPAPAETPRRHVDDPCSVMCQRNARCGAFQDGCEEQCAQDLRVGSACSSESAEFVQCHADSLEPESCTGVPPACEAAYCAYTRCVGRVQPAYCP